MYYQFSMLQAFVATILKSVSRTGHARRIKAITALLQGLLVVKQASLSGMGRGVAVIDKEKGFRGQLKRAHRWMKNQQVEDWPMAAAFFAYMTKGLQHVFISVDWTRGGLFQSTGSVPAS